MNSDSSKKCNCCLAIKEMAAFRKTKSGMCIDHDHKTGEVRGLLCGNCNSGIGMLGDDPRLLEKAIVYLSKQSHPYYDIDKDYENLGPASVCN